MLGLDIRRFLVDLIKLCTDFDDIWSVVWILPRDDLINFWLRSGSVFQPERNSNLRDGFL